MGSTVPYDASAGERTDAREGAPRARGRQWAAALIANLAAVCAGTAVSWSAPVLPVLQGDEQDVGAWAGNWTQALVPRRALTESEGALVASLVPLGALVGALPAGALVHLLGMRRPLLALAGLFGIGWALIMLAGPGGVGLMLAGRAVHGVATGATTVLVPRYCDEVAEVAIRGALGALLDLSLCNGVLLVYVMALGFPYALLTIIAALVPIIFAVAFFFMPESPVHLAKSGHRKEALEALAWLRPGWSPSALEKELGTLTAEDGSPDDPAKPSPSPPPASPSVSPPATPPPPLYEDAIAHSLPLPEDTTEQPPPPFSEGTSFPFTLPPSSPPVTPPPAPPSTSPSSPPSPASVRRRSSRALSQTSPAQSPAQLLSQPSSPPSPLPASQSLELTPIPSSNPLSSPTAAQPGSADSLSTLKQSRFSYTDAKGIFIVYSLMFLQQAAAISAVIAYANKIFTEAGGSLSPRVATVVLGALQSAAGVVAAATVERAGRRPLLVGSSVVVGASLAALAAVDGDAVPWLPPAALGIYIAAFELGIGPLPWFITAELVGPAAGGGAVSVNWAMAAIVTETFPALSSRFGQRSVFAAFGVMAGVAAIFSLFLVPETRGKTRAQLREELRRWPRRTPRRTASAATAGVI